MTLSQRAIDLLYWWYYIQHMVLLFYNYGSSFYFSGLESQYVDWTTRMLLLTAKFGISRGRPVRPVWPTGQTGLVCTVRLELGFFCKESVCNPTCEVVRLSRAINIKPKAN